MSATSIFLKRRLRKRPSHLTHFSTEDTNQLTGGRSDVRMRSDRVMTVDREGNVRGVTIPAPKKSTPSTNADYLKYMGLGYYLVIPLVGCIFLGILLDKIFKVPSFFLMVFFGIGIISTFYNLFKLLKDEQRPTH